MELFVGLVISVSIIFFALACLMVHKMKIKQPFYCITPYIVYSMLFYALSGFSMIVLIENNNSALTSLFSNVALIAITACLIFLYLIHTSESKKGSFEKLHNYLTDCNYIAGALIASVTFVNILAH